MNSSEIKAIQEAIQSVLVKEQDFANKAACETFSALIKDVKTSLVEIKGEVSAIKQEVAENTEWRTQNNEDVLEIHNFLEFLRYGRKFGIMAATVVASIGVILGAIYGVKEWINKP